MFRKSRDISRIIILSLICFILGFSFVIPIFNKRFGEHSDIIVLAEGENWHNTSFSHRKSITINHSLVDTTLSNFPILVDIDSDGELANNTQSDGDDVYFVLYSDNTTKLNHEIEYYNNDSNYVNASIWVNITSLSSTVDTVIWMYYGNGTCGSQENVGGTWDSNYRAVWHLNETGTGTRHDSTSNSNDGTPVGYGGTESTIGMIDGADEFDGTNDYINCGVSDSFNFTYITLEAWIKPVANVGWDTIIGKNTAGDSGIYWFLYQADLGLFLTGVTASDWNSDCSVTMNQWNYVTTTWDGTTIEARTNFSEDVDTSTDGGSITAIATELLISDNERYSPERMDSIIDEIRLSNVARNDSWLNATYNTIAFPDDFIGIGSEETQSLESKEWNNITQGWFTFNNVSSNKNIYQGWISFSNTSSYNTNEQGYFTFGNTSTDTTISLGWFNFLNTSNYISNDQGWFSFENSSVPGFNDNKIGWFTFSNLSSDSNIDTGWFSFENSSSLILKEQGWFMFKNTSNYINTEQGWFTFENTSELSYKNETNGWFIFSNTSSNKNNNYGYFTFSNSSSYNTYNIGYFTFRNTSDYTTSENGWFTFSNATEPLYQNSTKGWFTFTNSSSNDNIISGYFTFGNSSAYTTEQSGWFTFENSTEPEYINTESGWFTFSNTSLNKNTDQGWFSFKNTSSFTTYDSGWFTFSNTPTFNINNRGYFTFQNTSSYINNDYGWFSFENTTPPLNHYNITRGWFLFENTTEAIQNNATKGWITFRNTSSFNIRDYGYFTFGNISDCTVSNINPSNRSSNVDITLDNLTIKISSSCGVFNYSIEFRGLSTTENLALNGTKYLNISSLGNLSYDTTYTWYVNISGCYVTVNYTYTFTTESIPSTGGSNQTWILGISILFSIFGIIAFIRQERRRR